MMFPMVVLQVGWELPGFGMVTPEARIHQLLPLILMPKLTIPLPSVLSSTSTGVLTGKITVFSIIFHLPISFYQADFAMFELQLPSVHGAWFVVRRATLKLVALS
jgi:hypothetical protein